MSVGPISREEVPVKLYTKGILRDYRPDTEGQAEVGSLRSVFLDDGMYYSMTNYACHQRCREFQAGWLRSASRRVVSHGFCFSHATGINPVQREILLSFKRDECPSAIEDLTDVIIEQSQSVLTTPEG